MIATEAWLIVEVSQTSLPKDRGVKAALYAESGVPGYWVVNLPDRVVEVYTDPQGGEYRTVTRRTRGESIPLVQARDVTVAVSDFVR